MSQESDDSLSKEPIMPQLNLTTQTSLISHDGDTDDEDSSKCDDSQLLRSIVANVLRENKEEA